MIAPFIPLLVDISHVEFAVRQPEWREALGAATSIALQGRDVGSVVPRIVAGLRQLGVASRDDRRESVPAGPATAPMPGAPHAGWVAPPSSAPPVTPARTSRRVVVLGVVLASTLVLLLVVGIVAALTSGDDAPPAARPAASSQATPSEQPVEDPSDGGSTAVPDPDGLASAADVTIATPLGEMTVGRALLMHTVCPPWSEDPADCNAPTTGDDRYVVLILTGRAGVVGLSESFNDEAYASWIGRPDGQRVDPVQISLDAEAGSVQVVYALLTDASAEEPLVLFWPDTEPLRLTPTEG